MSVKVYGSLASLVLGSPGFARFQNRQLHTAAEQLVRQYTKKSRQHLTPEIALHLLTSECAVWNERIDPEQDHPLQDPFWAFYWPGGQGVTRYVLDYPQCWKGKRVLDFGSGCGASAIAAVLAGASTTTANDIDPVAIEACLLNSQLNNVSISVCGENLIGSNCDDYDAVFVGDMLYDSTLSSTITEWLRGLKNRGKTVLIGDPGRTGRDDSLTYFRLIAKYELDPVTKKDNSGFNHTFVYTII